MSVDCSDCAAHSCPEAISKTDGTIFDHSQWVNDAYVPGDANRGAYANGNKAVGHYTLNDVILCHQCSGCGGSSASNAVPDAAAQTGANVGTGLSQVGNLLGGSVGIGGAQVPIFAVGIGVFVLLKALGGKKGLF